MRVLKKKIILVALAALTLSNCVWADEAWCQLGVPCPIYNDLLIDPPYVGMYMCTLNSGEMEDLSVELTLLTKNTVAEPASLILSRGPHSDSKHSGILKITPNPALKPDGRNKTYFRNAISISGPLQPVICDETKPNTCEVPPTVTCTRIIDCNDCNGTSQ